MNGFKSFFSPADSANGQAQQPTTTVNMVELPNSGASPAPRQPNKAFLGTGGASTPTGTLTPGGASEKVAPSNRSIRSSVFPHGDFRRNSATSIVDLKTDMMVQWLHNEALRRGYMAGMGDWEGVVLKKAKGVYTCYPPHLMQIEGGLFDMVSQMNVRCAVTVSTRVVQTIMSSRRAEMDSIPLPDGLRVQVLPSIQALPQAKPHHFCAFIQDAQMMVIWDDEPDKVLQRATQLESSLMEIIWGTGEDDDEADDDEKGKAEEDQGITPEELESGQNLEVRPVCLGSACVVALTLIICMVCLGLGVRNLVYQILVDGNYVRLALLAAIPPLVFVSLFFFQSIACSLFQLFGPVSAVYSNSKYYSGKAPRRLRGFETLPHVTIQMPVYKEGLAGVIRPTVQSLRQAISTYEMQGGTANIFINDDGMQLMEEELAQARRDFYEEHKIGWVARPAHNPEGKNKDRIAFERRGKFKKASNMNYALNVSNRVEDKLKQVQRGPGWNTYDEAAAYETALREVVEEDQGRTWADGDIRMGDYILLIDSDTRVPKDCLLSAVSEMEQSPAVAIIQYSSGVMRVTDSYFERGVEWFTNLIYTSITFAVSIGDVACFVGHNAILRWSALQQIPYRDDHGYDKYWGENTVSEDFEMALRLQNEGYHIRFASYTGDGFQEGVSLTVYDELNRWEKYAYGCNELVFHPLKYWLFRGPFTPLFRKFIFSNMHLPKKLTILAYVGTYYAIGCSWILTLMNYFLTGWFWGHYDKFYVDSFAIYLSVIVVFTGVGNLALAILRYRVGQQDLIPAIFNNIKWIPMFTIFLGGLSLHLSQAILAHFFSIDMNWGATTKEVEEVHFGKEVVNIFSRFKWTFIFCFGCVAIMVCGAFVFPLEWRIKDFASIFPLGVVVFGHFALPLALNPILMMLSW